MSHGRRQCGVLYRGEGLDRSDDFIQITIFAHGYDLGTHKGIYMKEIGRGRYLFQFFHQIDVKRVFDGSYTTFGQGKYLSKFPLTISAFGFMSMDCTLTSSWRTLVDHLETFWVVSWNMMPLIVQPREYM